jgi:glycosyltransferase involved in cell wall biosynthesis
MAAPSILFINRNAVLGGVERVMVTCMLQAREHGFRPVLACPDNGPLPGYATDYGFDVEICAFDWMQRTINPYRLSRYALGLRREGLHVLEICTRQNVKLLYAHGAGSPLYAVHAAKTLDLPVLYHLHDAIAPNRFIRAAMAYCRPHISHVICVSEASRDLARTLCFSDSNTEVIYNGVSTAFLGAAPEPTPEITGPGPHIGIVGAIVELKGQHILLAAAERILQRAPSAHFWIIGSVCHPDDQHYLDRLHAIANRPSLNGHVTFTGSREDIPRWMVALDAVVMASTLPEALPTVVLEAMALGRRVVATNIGGQLEILRDGETGVLIPPGDPTAMADALLDVVNRPASDTMGDNAALEVRSRFTPERFGSELARVYNRLIPGAPLPIPS